MTEDVVRPHGGEAFDRLETRAAVLAVKKNRSVSYYLINSRESSVMTPDRARRLLSEWAGDWVLEAMGTPFGPIRLTPRELKKFIPKRIFMERLLMLRKELREAERKLQKEEHLVKKVFGR